MAGHVMTQLMNYVCVLRYCNKYLEIWSHVASHVSDSMEIVEPLYECLCFNIAKDSNI